jgi:DNA-binding MarR family transcriptional regulator
MMLLSLHPYTEYTIADLAERLSVLQSTVSGEVQRLAGAGIIDVRPSAAATGERE